MAEGYITLEEFQEMLGVDKLTASIYMVTKLTKWFKDGEQYYISVESADRVLKESSRNHDDVS